MNLREYKQSSMTAFPFMSATLLDSQYVCSRDFQQILERYLLTRYGNFEIQPYLEELGDVTTQGLTVQILSTCDATYLANKYRYEKLAKTLDLIYNPIENYSMEEIGTDSTTRNSKSTEGMTESGKDSTTGKGSDTTANTESGTDRHYHTDIWGKEETSIIYGATSTTDSVGEQTTSKDLGAMTTTDTLGSQTNTTSYGATSEERSYGSENTTTNDSKTIAEKIGQTNKVSAFNSSEYVPDSSVDTSTDRTESDKSTFSKDARKDTISTSAKKDSNDIGQRKDTHEVSAHKESDTIGAREDTHTSAEHTDTTSSIGHTDDKEGRDEHEFNATITKATTSEDSSERSGKRDTIVEGSGQDTTTHTFKRAGNIGTLTTQSMIESERQVANFNLVKIVAQDLIKLLCICVY